MIRERISNLANRAIEAAQDPETQTRLRGVAHTMGESAIGGALGEDGLDIMKTDRHGNQRVKKVKAARVAARAIRNPIGVAQKAARGVAREARATATSTAVETARGVIGSRHSQETPAENDMFADLQEPREPAAPDTSSDLFGDDFWGSVDQDAAQSESSSVQPTRRERIAGGLSRLHPGRHAQEETADTTRSIPTSREDLMSDDFWNNVNESQSTPGESSGQGRLAGIKDRLHRGQDEQPPAASPPTETLW